jgi:hypothetical protein
MYTFLSHVSVSFFSTLITQSSVLMRGTGYLLPGPPGVNLNSLLYSLNSMHEPVAVQGLVVQVALHQLLGVLSDVVGFFVIVDGPLHCLECLLGQLAPEGHIVHHWLHQPVVEGPAGQQRQRKKLSDGCG